MTMLEHLNTPTSKPGLSFAAKGAHGFAGKLHTAVSQNFHGLGTLKDNSAALAAINSEVLKQQHHIRQGGFSKFQAEKMLHKISHEAAMKGQHLSATEHEAVKKLTHHLSKPIIQRDMSMAGGNVQQSHGIASISATHHTASVSQIGDQTRMVSSGSAVHASSGISNLIKNKNNPISAGMSGPSRPTTPRIKLSI